MSLLERFCPVDDFVSNFSQSTATAREQAVTKAQTACKHLIQDKLDNQVALGNMKAAAGDIQAAI